MRVNLMIEGQESVTWPQWQDLARTAEGAGLEGLFRSDHYQSVQGLQQRSSLDAWATISALATLTERIRLGTMVSPASFRHPSVLAKSAVTADHVSGGRVELGLGAGWLEAEHRSYGFPFLPVATRYDVLEEQIEIIARQMTEERFDFRGEHYTLEDCRAEPKPVQQPRMPLIVGGTGKPRGVSVAAAWADEYNLVFPTVETARQRKEVLDRACADAGRAPLTMSIMTGCLVGADRAELHERAGRLMRLSAAEGTVESWLAGLGDTWIVGTLEEAAARIESYAAAGVERVMLQQQLHDDLEMVGVVGQLS